MSSSMPLAAPVALMDKVAVVGTNIHTNAATHVETNRSWTWGELHRASIKLAASFSGAGAICNLCGSYPAFVITMLAGLRCGCLQLLPPSRGNADLVASLKPAMGAVIVVDNEKLLRPEWLVHCRYIVFKPDDYANMPPDGDLAWTPPWSAPLLRLYTSGTTGNPEPKAKTLKQLVQGALLLGSRITKETGLGLSERNCLISSVAPQHMFGLEASVMLPLVYDLPVLDSRPLLPADVSFAFDVAGVNSVWITTPVHLSALSRCGDSVGRCAVVLSSTMSLAATVAARIEKQVGAPVLEVYGSTETGALATRKTASTQYWCSLPGVKIEQNIDGAVASGDHFDSPQYMGDRLTLGEDQCFVLSGRKSDLIKIGGRRASLAGLNLMLKTVPFLDDATFFLPDVDGRNLRLVLIYVGANEVQDKIKPYLRDRIDAVFMPRTFIRVHRLPRTDEGKLYMPALRDIYQTWENEQI